MTGSARARAAGSRLQPACLDLQGTPRLCPPGLVTLSPVLPFLQTLGWLACVVYATVPSFWLLIHPRAEHWRSQRRSAYRILLPAWMLMWIVVAAATASWRAVFLYQGKESWIPAAILFSIGLWIYFQAARGFTATQLGGLPELHPNHAHQQLVTTGIRARVRHPVYLAHLLEMLGWSLGTGLVVCYALTLFALATGAVMIRMEDAELERRFGDAFRAYKRTVPALIPRP